MAMTRITSALIVPLCCQQVLAQEPPLPAGLGSEPPATRPEPSLPAGLGTESASPTSEPANSSTNEPTNATTNVRANAFAEVRYGRRIRDDALQPDATLTEARLHVEAGVGEQVEFFLAADLITDVILQDEVSLRRGKGLLDLREATASFRPTDFTDVKIGRQVISWGTGDLIFINDIFPKDFESFFSGRSVDYLKAPADAVRISLYSRAVNLDLVVIPFGATDRFVDGSRLSFFDPATGMMRGSADPLKTDFADDPQYAARLYRTYGNIEIAAYGFAGSWMSPAGIDPQNGDAIFPDLSTYGASLRGPLFGGIAHAETGYFDSLDDRDGNDPLIANSEWRTFVGFEREIARETTLGIQYSSTLMTDNDAYLDTLGEGVQAQDKRREIATLRLTRLFQNQTLQASAFVFHSPTQDDGYVRLGLNYVVDDHTSVGTAFNLFYGDEHTPFGQLTDASQVVFNVRYGL